MILSQYCKKVLTDFEFPACRAISDNWHNLKVERMDTSRLDDI